MCTSWCLGITPPATTIFPLSSNRWQLDLALPTFISPLNEEMFELLFTFRENRSRSRVNQTCGCLKIMVCKEIQSHPFLFIMVFSPTNQLFFVLYNTIHSFFNGFLAYKAANQLIFVLPINTISILLGSSVSLTWSFMERQTVEVKEIKAFWEGVKSSNAPPWCRLFVWQMTIYCKRELPSC